MDTKPFRMMSEEERSRIAWKVSPLTGRKIYDFEAVEDWHMAQVQIGRASCRERV